MVSIWSRRGRVLLGAIGLVLVSAPVIGAHIMITLHARERAQREVTEFANDFITQAETAIDSGLIALTELALAGVGGCGERDLDHMRRTVYANFWIKEVGIIDRSGQIACNHIGDPIAVKQLSRPHASRNKNISLRLVELGSGNRPGVMLVWSLNGRAGLSAIVPSDAVVDGPLPKYLRNAAIGTMTLSDGAVVGSFPRAGNIDPRPRADEDVVAAIAASERYPLSMNLSVPYAEFLASGGNLLSYVRTGGALVSALIFALLVYVLRGPPLALARLSEAASRDEFMPYYQPMIDIASGRLVGCEVLMRWHKPDGSVVTPDGFIHLAEASGLAGPMTTSLMRRVRSDLDEVFGRRPALKISINLFNWHFSRLATVRDIQKIFGGARLAYGQLIFELTERQPLADIKRARVVIRGLQELGARVALDDAGTGHSGLAYLHQLGVDVVKIDKLFIDTISAAGPASPIVESLIKLGHDLGMEVTAEGVETFEQLDYLRARGADVAQGYLFSPPMPAKAFIDLVTAMEPVTAAAAVGSVARVAAGAFASLTAKVA